MIDLKSRTSGWVDSIQQLLNQNRYAEERQQARAKYCPQLTYGRHFAPWGPTARPAAVMILLELPDPDSHWSQCTIPLTVRPLHLVDHPGQISLPGGRLNSAETFLDAALRELHEELGIQCDPASILGPLLPLWVFNSNYQLQPFLAIQMGSQPYIPCQREVARVIRFPASILVEQQEFAVRSFSRGQVQWQAGVFSLEEDCIWGATAIVLAELAAIFRLLESPELLQD
jgi:8-oxo-dGTP pyrophosphatase MutT (NUDIX family)